MGGFKLWFALPIALLLSVQEYHPGSSRGSFDSSIGSRRGWFLALMSLSVRFPAPTPWFYRTVQGLVFHPVSLPFRLMAQGIFLKKDCSERGVTPFSLAVKWVPSTTTYTPKCGRCFIPDKKKKIWHTLIFNIYSSEFSQGKSTGGDHFDFFSWRLHR